MLINLSVKTNTMSNPLINPTHEIIPVNLAIAKTTNWRNFMQQAAPATPPGDLPKAVYISRGDIMDLAAYCEADDKILGVRAYFTLESEFKADQPNLVKFIMVLVEDAVGYPNGKDMLYVPVGPEMRALSPDGDGDGDSNIYDFTQPCPSCCDPDSDLYGDDSLQRPFRRKR